MYVLRRAVARFRIGERARPEWQADLPDTEDIVCLAFSRKYGGRCVAGLSLRTGEWVRPVSQAAEGTLMPNHYRLEDGSSPRVLDVIRTSLGAAKQEPYQPENRLVGTRRWKLLARPAPAQAWQMIRAAVSREPYLFGRPGDRIAVQDLANHPANASLCLVAPQDVRFVSMIGYRGLPQARLRFSHAGVSYRLSVTDPEWELRIAGLPDGEYPAAEMGVREDRILLTVSLGEPFEGACYKLVAAIFESPEPLDQ